MDARKIFTQLMIAITLTLVALTISANVARAEDGFVGPEKCAVCHKAEAAAWANAPHADAMRVKAFVSAWNDAKSPAYCLECHTTGYNPKTGKFAFEGVTCESCHGPLVSDHPKQPMKVNKSSDMCGQCHKSTMNELNLSLHGQKGLTCTSCHDVHGSTVKAGSSSELCAKCHTDMAGKLPHATTSGKGLSCADCHVGPRSGNPAEGHANTGHMFKVGTDACSRCHSTEMHTGVKTMMGGNTATIDVTVKPTATAPAKAAESSVGAPLVSLATALPLVGGIAIGLLLGIGWSIFNHRKL